MNEDKTELKEELRLEKTTPYYWEAKPTPAVESRWKKILAIMGDGTRAVRNVTYKLHPGIHGKKLDNNYNTTTKDLVRLRTRGLLRFDQIKESRAHANTSHGYKDLDTFIKAHTPENLADFYCLDRRPAHIKPIEVWFEKETVIDEFEDVCGNYDITTLTIRGEPQWSSIAIAASRLTKDHILLYFGDNDKRGREMFICVKDYIRYVKWLNGEPNGNEPSFLWCGVTTEQETKHGLPSNARLDGFDEEDLKEIIEEAVAPYLDQEKLMAIAEQEEKEKEYLTKCKLKFIEG